jgi:hypothetical protein
MITNTGKEIIAKYLIGTAPAFASYLAIGCGAKPRSDVTSISGASSSGATVTVGTTASLWVGAKIEITSGTGTLSTVSDTLVTAITSSTQFTVSPTPTVNLSSATILIHVDPSKEVLDFEMFRVPITSRGYTNDNGVNKLIFTAELPTEERYEISEIGLFSAGANSSATSYDSRTITPFASTEGWEYNDGTTISSPTVITEKITNSSNLITSSSLAIQTNSNNLGFLDSTRAARYERCRYLNNIIMLRGDTSNLTSSGGIFSITSGAKFLQLTGQTVDLSRNSTADLLKVAFSVVNKDGASITQPDTVRVLIEFSNSDGTQYARMNAEITNTIGGFSTNRYFVISKRLDQLTYSTGSTFSWKDVSTIKIYASALIGSTPSSNYFIALDAIRLDNVATINPLYGMTGYSIIQNTNSETIIKSANTNNYVEFRVITDVT